jgi:hypothetical protein
VASPPRSDDRYASKNDDMRCAQLLTAWRSDVTTYKLTLGSVVKFESKTPEELALHLVETFPPDGAFPSPNALNSGFAIVLPDGKRLQGLFAMRWIAQHH